MLYIILPDQFQSIKNWLNKRKFHLFYLLFMLIFTFSLAKNCFHRNRSEYETIFTHIFFPLGLD